MSRRRAGGLPTARLGALLAALVMAPGGVVAEPAAPPAPTPAESAAPTPAESAAPAPAESAAATPAESAAAMPTDAAAAAAAYAAGRYDEARRLWMPGASAGDPDAALGLAMLYDLGEGVQRDARTAYGWYEQAARDGVAAAELNLAVMRDAGDGVKRDASLAALWYARAAARGSHRAQYDLAQLYAAGEGVGRNPAAASVWFRLAAASLPAAARHLAELRPAPLARLPQGANEAASLRPVQLAAPDDGSAIAASSLADGAVELVWTAPAQAVRTRFFVQVLALAAPQVGAASREVFAAYVDETATLATLGRRPGRYAWRVYTVSADLRHYAATGWSRFDVEDAQAPSRRAD